MTPWQYKHQFFSYKERNCFKILDTESKHVIVYQVAILLGKSMNHDIIRVKGSI